MIKTQQLEDLCSRRSSRKTISDMLLLCLHRMPWDDTCFILGWTMHQHHGISNKPHFLTKKKRALELNSLAARVSQEPHIALKIVWPSHCHMASQLCGISTSATLFRTDEINSGLNPLYGNPTWHAVRRPHASSMKAFGGLWLHKLGVSWISPSLPSRGTSSMHMRGSDMLRVHSRK